MYQAKGRDCFYFILRRWKSILVVALIASVLMGGFDVYKTLRRWDNDEEQCRKDKIAYEDSYEIAASQDAAYDARIEEIQDEVDELNDNALVSFDRTSVGTASIYLQFIATPDETGAPRQFPAGLMSYYTNAIMDLTDWDLVASKGGLKRQEALDLFNFTVDDAGHILYLKMYGETEENAVNMLEELLNQINAYTGTLDEETRAAFTVKEVNRLSKSGQDEGFAAIQDNYTARIQNLINEITSINNLKAEIPYPAPAPTMPTTADVIKSVIKYIVFGFGCGAFAMICLYYLLFFFNGKLHSAEELGTYAGIGPNAYPAKKYGPIDRLIAKKENRGLLLDTDEAIMRTVRNIKSMYPEVNTVAFTGADSEAYVGKLKPSLEKIKDLGLRFGLERNILTDKEAYDHLAAYDAVVLVEKLDRANAVVIQREVEQIEIAGKKVAGAILVR